MGQERRTETLERERVVTSFYLPAPLHAALRAAAEREERSASNIVRRALKSYLAAGKESEG
jgi:predicted transcriptional regulator